MGLPLGRQVEVWLVGEIRLRGKLRLQEEVLFMKRSASGIWGWRWTMLPSPIGRWNRA